jgi:hypothetical protein
LHGVRGAKSNPVDRASALAFFETAPKEVVDWRDGEDEAPSPPLDSGAMAPSLLAAEIFGKERRA